MCVHVHVYSSLCVYLQVGATCITEGITVSTSDSVLVCRHVVSCRVVPCPAAALGALACAPFSARGD